MFLPGTLQRRETHSIISNVTDCLNFLDLNVLLWTLTYLEGSEEGQRQAGHVNAGGDYPSLVKHPGKLLQGPHEEHRAAKRHCASQNQVHVPSRNSKAGSQSHSGVSCRCRSLD